MSNIEISLIIPAYNAEAYLQKCIDSCLKQNGELPKYEIIIVNDGSTDGTQTIIDEYAERNGIISFISQENGGLSRARNVGLEKAKGEYVWFVDSDDWIADNALCVLSRIIKTNHPDVVAFRGYDWIEGVRKVRRSPFMADEHNLSGIDILKRMGTVLWCPCVPLYCMRRQFLLDHSLTFMEGVIHEDSEFTPRMLYMAQTAYITSEIMYYVFQNPVSLNRRKNPQKGFHTLRVVDSLCRFSDSIYNKNEKKLINDIIATTMNMGMKETKDMDKMLLHRFCDNIQKSVSIKMLLSSKLRYKIEGLLLMSFPYSFVYYVRMNQ